jgi:hypothetical protein
MGAEPIIPASYWVTDVLAAGQYPGSKDPAEAATKVARFRAAGVTTFVDLTHPDDGLEPYAHLIEDARRLHHPIVDNDIPTVDEMRRALDAVDNSLADGETVYVHCWGGHGRTGTVVGCWLVRHGSTPGDAIELIREWRRPLPVYELNPHFPPDPRAACVRRGMAAGDVTLRR